MDQALVQHKELADGRWAQMTLAEQLGNVGSEVSRALNWRNKDDKETSYHCFVRALELIDFTLAVKYPLHQLREIARAREVLVDYFAGTNIYKSTEKSLRSYFDFFALIARQETLKNRK